MNQPAGRWTSPIRKFGGAVRRWAVERGRLNTMQAKTWAIALAAMGFLLGRATILGQLSPFAIAYFAVVYFLRRDMLWWVGGSLILGTLFSVAPHTGYLVTSMLVFLLIQKALEKYERSELSHVPLIVCASTFLVQAFSLLAHSRFTWYSFVMIAVESVLGFILCLIFIQALPVFTMNRKNLSLRNEEIICLIILLASVMTGTAGWQVGTVTVEHVLSRYLILLFALVGGAPLGASVGVVTGIILSLADVNAIYQMSLLAFAGLLAGLLKEGRKPGVALGMLLGTSILSVYVGNQPEVLSSTWESLAAIALLIVTPRYAVQLVSRFVPGTLEHLKSQHDYAKRVRDITAGRVEQFSEVFRQLAQSFRQIAGDRAEEKTKDEFRHFMDAAAEQACANCWKNNRCWNQQFYQTCKLMTDMVAAIEANERITRKEIDPEWKKWCVKPDQVLEIMKRQYSLHKNDQFWKKQIVESRQLVADQLAGVSRVMEDLAKEIKREGQELYLQEEQIRHALEELGLSIHSIDIISLDEGNVEIEIVHQFTKGFDECRKIIAPLLSDILGENIAVKSEQFHGDKDSYCTVTFGSAKEYEVETGVAGAAKGGDILSGDSFSIVELGNGKFAVALSDGMGNGERAREESSTALAVLQQLLRSGMDERLAIKSVNSILMLRSPDEMYATVDMAIIDLYSAQTTFMKIGSTPSFVKRGNEVIQVSASNLPVGIVQEIDIELVGMALRPGDILIMMTDGIYDAPGHAVNKDLWIKRIILEIEAENPQSFADCLLERVVRYHHGEIHDDMTVIVARIEKYKPEWATFSWPGLARIERPKTVS
jgi:stage II sporulation protein E